MSAPNAPETAGIDGTTEVDEDALLTALQDDDCRTIVEAVSEEALSASELAERCDLPLSTTYRKVDTLTDAALLDERLRLAASGSHEREYVPGTADLTISVGAGASVEVHAESTASEPAQIPTFAD
ncbi:helix-turn-helix transcriptional regulator [Halorubellus sp. JP-L1]|uniref:winged helix-turn-helix domain-containing protein n=1 Tax=Halorubellus sp. JP-L1 TaxID=2715753 RepID=UPI00140E93CA|nr:helix-turn-helix domain-containing protein [Halorubellus sp. JP-L1]NHN42361.1 helix-turn-helix transcriptional regulator [Halorubellus sp. JP-L1]